MTIKVELSELTKTFGDVRAVDGVSAVALARTCMTERMWCRCRPPL
jgi:hypothetical protein